MIKQKETSSSPDLCSQCVGAAHGSFDLKFLMTEEVDYLFIRLLAFRRLLWGFPRLGGGRELDSSLLPSPPLPSPTEKDRCHWQPPYTVILTLITVGTECTTGRSERDTDTHMFG